MKKRSMVIPLIFLLTGFVSAYFFLETSPDKSIAPPNKNYNKPTIVSINNASSAFLPVNTDISNEDRLTNLETEIIFLKKELEQVSQTLALVSSNNLTNNKLAIVDKPRTASLLNRRLYNYENLVRGGIDQITAEDIVRRKNNIELQRLALQDKATRNNYLNTQQYYDELNAINSNDVNLRDELGDDRYDQYLYTSKQHNRVRISSVMLGSAAEEVGIQKGDVILSYNTQRMFTWQELKQATAGGNLGEFVSITINRSGEIYSFSVPRGPLGVQLGASRLEP